MLLVAGAVLGCTLTVFFPAFTKNIFASVFRMLADLGQTIFEDQGALQGTLTLFWHNLRAVLGMIILGMLLGLFPLMGMLINGGLLGVVLALAIMNGQILAFMAGVIPHAIFELPALVIGAGAGLFLGWGPFRRNWPGYGPALKQVLNAALLAFVLLAVAAVIEVNITPWLLGLAL
jgi:stage II sporulation protein M